MCIGYIDHASECGCVQPAPLRTPLSCVIWPGWRCPCLSWAFWQLHSPHTFHCFTSHQSCQRLSQNTRRQWPGLQRCLHVMHNQHLSSAQPASPRRQGARHPGTDTLGCPGTGLPACLKHQKARQVCQAVGWTASAVPQSNHKDSSNMASSLHLPASCEPSV